MSERTWFAVHVRKRDARAFRKIVFEPSSCQYEEEPPEDEYSNAKYYVDIFADYAHYDECEDAAERGLIFEGRSGAGCEYGPARFCAIDGKFYHVETLWEDVPAVRYDEQACRIDTEGLQAIEKYLAAYQRVRSVLQGKTRRRR